MQQENDYTTLTLPSPTRNECSNFSFKTTDSYSIILAEDDIDEQFFFEEAIKDLPVKAYVKVVPDGVYLLNYLLDDASCKPDIIFLDIMMPRKNGIECLKEIKVNDRLKEIPIVMYSNSVGLDFIIQTYEYGAHYFLQKGNYSDLAESIGNIIHLVNENHKNITLNQFQFSLH
jgi:CheY-like chemotaxis protein